MTDYREIRSTVIYSAIVLATFFSFRAIVPQSAVKHQPPTNKRWSRWIWRVLAGRHVTLDLVVSCLLGGM